MIDDPNPTKVELVDHYPDLLPIPEEDTQRVELEDPDLVHFAVRRMMNERTLSDVTLICGDRRIPAHKALLASWSDFFKAMFTIGMKESTAKEVTMFDFDPAALEAAIEYMYTGHIEINLDNIDFLLNIAFKLQLESLKSACCGLLMSLIDIESCCAVLMHAEVYSLEDITQSAILFILRNFDEVSMTSGFLVLGGKTLKGLFESDELESKSEEQIFLAFSRWFTNFSEQHSTLECDQTLHELLPLIRFPLIPCPVLARLHLLQPATSLATNALFQALILEAFRAHFLSQTKSPYPSPLPNTDDPESVVDSELQDSATRATPYHDPLQERRLHPRIVQCHRIRRYQSICYDSWPYSSSPDAIKFSVNNPIFLRGISLYGSPGGHYEISLEFRDIGARASITKQIIKTEAQLESDHLFDNPIPIVPNRKYAVIATISGLPSPHGLHGCIEQEVSGVKFTFADSAQSVNGTRTLTGQIPSLIFSL